MDKTKMLADMLEKYSIYRFRISFLEKEKQTKSNENSGGELEGVDKELAQIRYLTETIDTSLELVREFNERYKIILESFYIHKVRMEDIAEMIHTSRSRCYELCKEALGFMARIVFGEDG